MEKPIVLTDENSLEEYELLFEWNLEKEKRDSLQKEKLELQSKIDFKNRIWKAISKVTGKEYTLNQRDYKQIPFDVICQAFDEEFGKKGDLIQPSHKILAYSLIKNRDLDDFIPEKVEGPHVLRALLKDSAVRSLEIIREYTSENTKRALNGDIVYWQAWLSAIGCDFKTPPITVDILKLFIVQHIEGMDPKIDKILVEQAYKTNLGTHALKTVTRRISSLSVCLDLDKYENPCRDKEVRILLGRLAKKYGKTNKKKAITKDILDDMLLTCKSSLIDTRDKALLLFAWSSGGRRRSEVTGADMANLTETPDGDFLYNLIESKTNQTGEDDYKPVKGRAAKALMDWLNASEVKKGPIFRSVGKGGDIRGALSGNDIRRIIKKRTKLAGYDESQFAGHSLRRGFVTESGRQGKPIGDVMKMTSHKSIATAMQYYEAGDINNNSCAELAG